MDEWDERRDGCSCAFAAWRVRPPVRRGDTLSFSLQVFQNQQTGQYGTVWPGEVAPPNCVVVNLTGWRVIFTAKYEFPDWDSQAVWQLDNQSLTGVVTTGTNGSVAVTGPAQNTVGFADGPTRLVYDVEGIDPSANVRTFETGSIVVVPDVTRIT
jgi:hypothetical protein